MLLISADGLRIEVFRPNRGKGRDVSDTPMTEPLEGDPVQVRVIAYFPCTSLKSGQILCFLLSSLFPSGLSIPRLAIKGCWKVQLGVRFCAIKQNYNPKSNALRDTSQVHGHGKWQFIGLPGTPHLVLHLHVPMIVIRLPYIDF